MNPLFALIPVKAPERGKSRLDGMLDDAVRLELNRALARSAIEVCAHHFGAARVVVVSPSSEICTLAGELGARALLEPAGRHADTLNAALSAAAGAAIALGGGGVVTVPTDLPLLSGEALAHALEALPEAPGCLVVPDRRGEGTNLLAMRPARTDSFFFGNCSSERHAEAARRLGYRVTVQANSALAVDLDSPEDLTYLEGMDVWRKSGSTTLSRLASLLGSTHTSRA